MQNFIGNLRRKRKKGSELSGQGSSASNRLRSMKLPSSYNMWHAEFMRSGGISTCDKDIGILLCHLFSVSCDLSTC